MSYRKYFKTNFRARSAYTRSGSRRRRYDRIPKLLGIPLYPLLAVGAVGYFLFKR